MSWRMAVPRDLSVIDALHDAQEAATGWKVDRPPALESPVLTTMLYEEDGQVLGGFQIEAVPELTFIGCHPKVTAAAAEIAEEMFAFLKSRKMRRLRCFIPKVGDLDETLGERLEGVRFAREDAALSHFSVSLVEGAADGANRKS